MARGTHNSSYHHCNRGYFYDQSLPDRLLLTFVSRAKSAACINWKIKALDRLCFRNNWFTIGYFFPLTTKLKQPVCVPCSIAVLTDFTLWHIRTVSDSAKFGAISERGCLRGYLWSWQNPGAGDGEGRDLPRPTKKWFVLPMNSLRPFDNVSPQKLMSPFHVSFSCQKWYWLLFMHSNSLSQQAIISW